MALEGPFSMIVKTPPKVGSQLWCLQWCWSDVQGRVAWPRLLAPAGRPQLGNLATAVYSQGRYDGTQPEPEPDIWQCSNNQH